MSINFITIKNIDNFKQIIESSIFIGCNNMTLDREISTNMWALSISSKILKNISLDNLLEFIKTLLYNRNRQISQFSCSAIFYMWFDEMASQLRFNIISDFHKKLPFSCKLNILDSPTCILKAFLESQKNPVIPWKDLEKITDSSDDIDDEISFVLDVFVVKLNKI